MGGSFLKSFGKAWFAHIKDRELRFALTVDKELENYFIVSYLKLTDIQG